MEVLIKQQAERIAKLELHLGQLSKRLVNCKTVKSIESGKCQNKNSFLNIDVFQVEQEEQMEVQRCTATQTDPVSSDDDDAHSSTQMNDLFVGNNSLNSIEYEKVILKRADSSCHLGITLCYGATDDNDTDIFISEIENGSIADLDGRLCVGDQILQINGETIHSRVNAIEQFRQNQQEICLLLARAREPDDAYDHPCIESPSPEMVTITQDYYQDVLNDANSIHSALEKDSGLSRTTDSDPEMLSPLIERARSSSPESAPITEIFDDKKLRRCTSDDSLERELASLHKEMETIRLECDRLISKHNNAEKRVAQQVAQASSLMNTIGELSSRGIIHGVEDTSSAYNTGGESCRSTPFKSDYAHFNDARKAVYEIQPSSEAIYHQVEQMGKYPHIIQTPTTSQCHSKFRLPKYSVVLRGSVLRKKENAFNSSNIVRRRDSAVTRYKPGETMYTSPDKLAETIALQQRLLRQAMVEQANMLKPNVTQTRRNEMCEWKIKRRADGTRYITRRPMRNRVLKQREEQLNKERIGISTDDDAMSELKTGRFWSREERKKHLESAKERKMRHHQILTEKNERPLDQTIVQLSHKKMMRRKGQQLFDKFTTIQEFLAHGNREPSNRSMDGILSVTTV